MIYRWLTLACLLVGWGAVASSETGWSRYRVYVPNEATAQKVADCPLPLFSEHIAPETDFVVGPGQLTVLDSLGLEYEFVQHLPAPDSWKGVLTGGDYRESYLPYDAIIAQYEAWRLANPDLVTRVQIGVTHQGRPIWAYRIWNPIIPQPRHCVMLLGGIHAREWVSPSVCMYLFNETIRRSRLFAFWRFVTIQVELSVIPVMNPDGYIYSWNQDRFWRKNRRFNGGGSYGVDLNRNFETGFGGEGSSGNPDSDVYRGPSAFSEPETAAVRDYFNSRPTPAGMIDYHSYSQLVLWPWGYTRNRPPDRTMLETIAIAYRDAVASVHGKNYTQGQTSRTLYTASGVSNDYFYNLYRFPAYAIELRDTGEFGFLLPEDQILPTQQENWAGFEAYLLRVLER